MILTGLFTILYYILYAITSPLRLVDDAVLPAGFSASIATAGLYLNTLGQLLPLFIQSVLVSIGLVLVLEVSILLWKLINWVIKKIPFIN